ncbi:MAG: T9SS type A sorting domain-containing protein [Bacteroidota bacterium]
MKKITTLLFLLVFFTKTYSQAPNWIWSTSPNGDAGISSLCLDHHGSVYSGGDYLGTLTIGSSTIMSAGSQDMHLEKHDSLGNPIWAKTYGSSDDGDWIFKVCTDAAGNVYSFGAFASDSIMFGSTLYDNGSVNSIPTMDVFILKHDTAGNLLWSIKSGGWKSEFVGDMVLDASGNIYVTGAFCSSTFGFDANVLNHASPGSNKEYFLVKLNPSGNTIWAKQSSSGYGADWGTGVAVDTLGNVYTIGRFDKASVTFGSTTLTNAFSGTSDGFIVKYAPGGNVLWAKSFGGNDAENCVSISLDKNNDILINGVFSSASITIGSATLTNAGPVGKSDIFLAKYSSSGNPAWAKRFGGSDEDFCYAAKYDSHQNIIIAGDYSSPSITFDTVVLYNTGAVGTNDLFVTKLDSLGNFIWTKTASGTKDEFMRGLAITADDKIVVSGSFFGTSATISFGSTTYTTGSFLSSAFIAKLNNIVLTTITGNVLDIGINFSTGSLDSADLGGCQVKLFQGSTLINTQTTNSTGDFSFTGLTSTNYKVLLTYTSGYPVAVTYNNLYPGDVLADVPLPYTLIGQANEAIDSVEIKHFSSSMFYNLCPLNFTAEGYNETNIQNLVDSCQSISGTESEDVTNSLGRLIIAQKALNEFSKDGAQMMAETVVSAYGFGEAIYSVATVNQKIIKYIATFGTYGLKKFALEKLRERIMDLGISFLKTAIIQSLDCVDDSYLSANFKAKLEGVMAMLIDKATAEDPDEYDASVASQMIKDLITAEATPLLYSNVYVDMLTQNNVNSTWLNAKNHNYTGFFDNAYNDAQLLVVASHNKTGLAVTEVEQSRNVSEITGSASDLALQAAVITSAFDGGTFLTIGSILKGISVGASGYALVTSVKRIANIIDELSAATAASFLPVQPMLQLPDPASLEDRSASFILAKNNYNSHLNSIGADIASGLRLQAILKIDSLMVYDSIMQNALKDALIPIYIAAPYATNIITDFDSIYNMTVIDKSCLSIANRQSVNYNLIAYLIDSTNTAITDSLAVAIYETTASNDQLDTILTNMTDSIASIPVPAHIAVTSTNIAKPMLHNTMYPVIISYKNYGTLTADDVYAKLILKPGFTSIEDSIYIGSIPVNGTGSITYNITSPNFDTISYLTVVFYSPNASSDGVGASLLVHDTTSTNILSAIRIENSFKVHPNPFNGNTLISYAIEQNASVLVEAYNILGAKVANIYSGNQVAGDYKLSWDTTNRLKPGVYFIRLKVNGKSNIQKIIILE